MKILVLSATAWADDNSFGLSFSNIFCGMQDLQFASVYTACGQPNNGFDMCFFQITAGALVRNLKNPALPTGSVVIPDGTNAIQRNATEQSVFNTARKLRWQVLFWARDMIWKIGRWDSPQFRKFLDNFQPDIIFQPIYYSSYLNDIALFIQQYTGAPMVGYISDDCYTLRQFRFSPLYWIDRFYKRKKVKRTIERCELLYVISEIQKTEYEKIFLPPCKILTKCADFDKPVPEWKASGSPLQLLYAGNLGIGRWKSLALIAEAVDRLNCEGYALELNIYSPTPLTKRQKRTFIKHGAVLHPTIPHDELQKVQQSADILIHVEGLSLKSRLTVHQSFSTKLVDYFALGKCVFAVGTQDVASIQHLIYNNAAIVAKNAQEVYANLKKLSENNELMVQCGKNAYNCGAKHHNKATMQAMLIDDLSVICKGRRNHSDSFAN